MGDKKKVLIGTYWTGQFDRWRGYYNYPIAEGDEISEADCKEVTRRCLFDRIADSCRISSPPCVKDEGPTIDPTFERDVQECDIPTEKIAIGE